jgi:trehalose 6-phosphate synthase/phosphatase
MAQVIIVSNRLPVTVKKVNGKITYETSMGGVATGLSSYVKSRKNKWVGWPGIPSDDLTEADKKKISSALRRRNCAPVFLSKKQLEDFYNGYSNSLLWPLFHSMQYDPSTHHTRWWKAYRSVNTAFATAIAEHVQTSSTIWVHDYQLMLLPSLLKQTYPANNIGFFLHIPFPDPKTFSKLPDSIPVLSGVLGADLIGFHTKSYVKNFLATVQTNDLALVEGDKVILGNRAVAVTDFPMGIDYEKFSGAAKLPSVKAAVKEFKHKYKGMKVIAGVDRLDITKGFLERLRAYQTFLRQNPKEHGKVVFALVGAPSRGEITAYKTLSHNVEALVADINAEFGTASWAPVDYNNKGLPFEYVTALFQIADVAFIAPIRDGMNLVAKEFIASKRKSGVLILSQTAGAAQELQDALLVNMKQPDTLVAALDQALHMRKREIKSRLRRMQKHLASNTVQTWAGGFMQTLQKPVPGTPIFRLRPITGRNKAVITNHFRSAKKRLLLLDYDGTLRAFAQSYKGGAPSKRLLTLLQKLATDKHTTVVIVSGRSSIQLEKWLDNLGLNMVAEHGGFTRKAGAKRWIDTSPKNHDWQDQVLPLLTHYSSMTPHSEVEIKEHSLVWHYRRSPNYYAQKYSVILKSAAKPYIKKYNLSVLQGNKILEIRNTNINKGSAIKPWLAEKYDFILIAGDDPTDENMFDIAPPTATTIKVGSGRTAAKFRAKDNKQFLELLDNFID